jgi:hypothetical protein
MTQKGLTKLDGDNADRYIGYQHPRIRLEFLKVASSFAQSIAFSSPEDLFEADPSPGF